MKSEHEFDKQLKQLHQARKEQIKLSKKQHCTILAILKSRTDKQIPWFNRVQFVLGIAAIVLLINIVYQKQSSTELFAQLYDASLYYQIEVHDYTNQQYSKTINQAHQQAKRELASALNNLAFKQLSAGRLMGRNKDWFIESCDKTRLVELKADLIKQLNLSHNIDLDLKTGDNLLINSNNQGEIIALMKASNLQSCG